MRANARAVLRSAQPGVVDARLQAYSTTREEHAPPAAALLNPNSRSKPMKKLVLETTAPFQGLPELVAYDEGLFAKEGLLVEWADREKDVEKTTDINVISPKGL